MHEHPECSPHAHHKDLLIAELSHHFPYAIMSLALGFIVLSFLHICAFHGVEIKMATKGARILFHSFHFLHIMFAASGSLVMFSRFSSNLVKGIVVSVCSSLFFCTISDVIVPYLSGILLGVSMRFHLCMVSELYNIIPFLVIGLVNGLVIGRHGKHVKGLYVLGSHFSHILISALASLSYLISEGLYVWWPKMGLLFAYQVIGVLIPCTLADVVVPVLFSRVKAKR
jgi:hypothetical protein